MSRVEETVVVMAVFYTVVTARLLSVNKKVGVSRRPPPIVA